MTQPSTYKNYNLTIRTEFRFLKIILELRSDVGVVMNKRLTTIYCRKNLHQF